MEKRKRELPRKPTAADMEITPERALAIKRALLRQYADQKGIEITGWKEIDKNGMMITVKIIDDKAVIQSIVPA